MVKVIAYRLIGVALIVFCGATWAWMLGVFAQFAAGVDPLTAKWLNPGILSMPAIISIIAGLIGLMYLMGVFPLFDGVHKKVVE